MKKSCVIRAVAVCTKDSLCLGQKTVFTLSVKTITGEIKMWPFGKKELKPAKLTYEDTCYILLKEFDNQCGGKFTYLGVDHIIVGLRKYYPRIGQVPRLVCHVAHNGTIETLYYDMKEFETIKKHGVFENVGSKKD